MTYTSEDLAKFHAMVRDELDLKVRTTYGVTPDCQNTLEIEVTLQKRDGTPLLRDRQTFLSKKWSW